MRRTRVIVSCGVGWTVPEAEGSGRLPGQQRLEVILENISTCLRLCPISERTLKFRLQMAWAETKGKLSRMPQREDAQVYLFGEALR